MPHYENVPFEVPEGWCWTTIGEVSSSILYGVSESAKEVGTYKLLRITDIQDNNVNWESVPFTNFDKDKATTYLLQEGDILFARTGATVGKSYLVSGLTEESIYASYLIRVHTSHSILPEYIKRFFESGYYWEQISLSSVGIGQPNVNGTTLASLNVPIPPYREQLRIVEEANRWLSLADILDDNAGQVDRVVESAKSKILDLAIHGKLVPQDSTDEPASELLKRINSKAVASCDNPQYCDLPTGWVVTPISELCDLISGRDLPASDCNNIGRGIPYLIGASNISDGKFDIVRWTDNPQVVSVENDILISCKGTIGEVVTNSLGEIHIARQFMALRIKYPQLLSEEYLRMFIIAIIEGIKNKARGVIPGISREDILSIDLLIPPKFEQKRILARTQDLYQQLERIS